MKRGWRLIAILVLVGIICAFAGPATAADPKVLKIAFLIPLSGPVAALGDLWKKSLDICIDILNERGVKIGQDTYKIQAIYADDQYSPQGAVAAANKVIFSDKVQFIASASPVNAALSPLTNANKVIFVNRNANGFTGYDPKTMPYNVYSHCLAEICAHYVYTAFKATPGVKTVGQLFVGNKGTIDEAIVRVKTFLEKNGAKVLEPEWYPIGTQDFTPYLSKMNAANIDMLSVFGPPTDVLNMAKQRFAQGKKYPIVQTTSILNLKALVAELWVRMCWKALSLSTICLRQHRLPRTLLSSLPMRRNSRISQLKIQDPFNGNQHQCHWMAVALGLPHCRWFNRQARWILTV